MTPVFVNVFNRLTTTRTLCDQIAKLNDALPVIIDNASDYEPLLDWYDNCEFEVLRLRENLGHHAPWISGILSYDREPFYVVTDCDLDLTGVPLDVLNYLRQPLIRDNQLTKVGLSLEINDLPTWQSEVISWELKFWKRKHRLHTAFFDAWCDTTFAIYRRDTPHRQAMGVRWALRADRPYTARHVPWYLDCDNLDEENQQYFATASAANTWKPNGMKLSSRFSKA